MPTGQEWAQGSRASGSVCMVKVFILRSSGHISLEKDMIRNFHWTHYLIFLAISSWTLYQYNIKTIDIFLFNFKHVPLFALLLNYISFSRISVNLLNFHYTEFSYFLMV